MACPWPSRRVLECPVRRRRRPVSGRIPPPVHYRTPGTNFPALLGLLPRKPGCQPQVDEPAADVDPPPGPQGVPYAGGQRRRQQRVRTVGRQAEHHPERSEEHTSELQSRENLVCRLLLEKKNKDKRGR